MISPYKNFDTEISLNKALISVEQMTDIYKSVSVYYLKAKFLGRVCFNTSILRRGTGKDSIPARQTFYQHNLK